MSVKKGLLLAKAIFAVLLACTLLTTNVIIHNDVAKATTQTQYYVDPVYGSDSNAGTISSPFQTITKARDTVRTVNGSMTGDIIVYLRGGTYPVSSTISLNQSDSGTNGYNVIYENYPGETPVISGGTQITGWTLYDSQHNIYRASVSTSLDTRQLFVNGVRATRARSNTVYTDAQHPAYGHGTICLPNCVQTSYGYTTTNTAIASWGNISDIEFVYQEQWTNPRCGVDSISVNGGVAQITMKSPGWYYCNNKGSTNVTLPLYIENAYELLDEPGEWYLDKTTHYIYYMPRWDEDLSKASVVAPTTERLFDIEGSSLSQTVHNIQFSGISCQYTTWLMPSTDVGLPDAQACIIRENVEGQEYPNESLTEACIWLKKAKNIDFNRCDFSKLGAAAINMTEGCQDNSITGCRFTDISGGGVQVGEVNMNDSDVYNPTDTRLILKNDDITDCYFDSCAVEYRSAVAVFAAYPQDMDISHNEICNLPYGGINMGWGWGLVTSCRKNNRVQYNYIHNIMTTLNDNGAVYIMGDESGSASEKTIISDNYAKDDFGNNGPLYFDNGCDWCDAYDNVFDISAAAWSFVNIGQTAHDNNVYDNYSTLSNYANAGDNCTVQSPTALTGAWTGWPEGALAIMDNAGLEAGYKDIAQPEPENLALGKTASCSSYWGAGMEANNAVDGDKSTIWASASGSSDSSPWWQVDLGSAYRVTDIQIVGRQDTDQRSCRRNFEVRASNSSNFSTYTKLGSQDGNGVGFSYQGIWNLSVADIRTYRYIRIVRTGTPVDGTADAHLNFAECRVFGDTNIAQGKTTSCSSYWQSGLEASNAVDGNTSTIWASASGSLDATPWWKVDLGGVYRITDVQIVGRQDQDQPSCRCDFAIQASNDSSFSTYTTIGSQGGNAYPYKGTWDLKVLNNNTYRYVRVIRTGTANHHLNFAECRVFGIQDVAFGKTTSRSSCYDASMESSKEVDEDKSTIWASASGSQDSTPWWIVDLGSAYQIMDIQLIGRQGTNQPDCRRNFAIQASNSSNFSTYTTLASQGGTAFPYQGIWERPVNDSNTYRYIRVIRTGTSDHHLNFAELRVYTKQ